MLVTTTLETTLSFVHLYSLTKWKNRATQIQKFICDHLTTTLPLHHLTTNKTISPTPSHTKAKIKLMMHNNHTLSGKVALLPLNAFAIQGFGHFPKRWEQQQKHGILHKSGRHIEFE